MRPLLYLLPALWHHCSHLHMKALLSVCLHLGHEVLLDILLVFESDLGVLLLHRYYMLFIVDSKGVPSTAPYIQLL